MLSLTGQGVSGIASILNESFPDAQLSPGADMGIGFSGTGEMHTDPFGVSADSAGHGIAISKMRERFRFMTAKFLGLCLNLGAETTLVELDRNQVPDCDLV
jgi:hypothetical protein